MVSDVFELQPNVQNDITRNRRGKELASACFLLVVVCVLSMSCSTVDSSIGNSSKRFEYSELHMGVQVRLVAYHGTSHEDEEYVRRVSARAFKEAKRLDDLLSDYKPESELSRLGRLAYPEAAEVSPELFEILLLAKEIYNLSDGYFDVSSGEVFRLWRTARETGELPPSGGMEGARKRSGMDKVLLDEETSMVLLKSANMQFDLGGIAKGYASERLLDIFRVSNIPAVLIDFGGSLAIGDAPRKGGWNVKINDENRSLANVFVSSSGSSFQYLEIDGKVYSHIVDPHSGQGIQGKRTFSVIDSNGARADAISTTLSVMPKNRHELFLATMSHRKFGMTGLQVILSAVDVRVTEIKSPFPLFILDWLNNSDDLEAMEIKLSDFYHEGRFSTVMANFKFDNMAMFLKWYESPKTQEVVALLREMTKQKRLDIEIVTLSDDEEEKELNVAERKSDHIGHAAPIPTIPAQAIQQPTISPTSVPKEVEVEVEEVAASVQANSIPTGPTRIVHQSSSPPPVVTEEELPKVRPLVAEEQNLEADIVKQEEVEVERAKAFTQRYF